MIYVLYTVFVLACVVLILAVLLQPGKADAGALFTSSVSSAAFGPRGTQTILAKITIVAAAVFMLTALMISMGIGGYRSVVGSGDATATPVATPAAPVAAQPGDEAPAEPDTAAPATLEAAPAAQGNTGGAANASGASPANSSR